MVPEGWKATQVGDVATFSSGGTPSKQTAGYWGGSEPWISGKDLKSHYLRESIDTLTAEGFAIAKKAPMGASLILVRGMTLLKDFPVGYASREMAFNQDIKALVPKSHVDGLFLSFLLVAQKNRIRQLVSTAGHGTGRLDTSLVKGYPINLPPHPEQKKIAQILSTWDQAITATEHLLENSQQRKKGLMQQLLNGKKRLPGFEEEWEDGHLKDIAAISKGKALSSKDLEDGVFPVVAGGKTSPYTHKTYTHDHAITVSASGAYAGYVAYHEYKFWASDCSVVEASEESNIEFLYHLMTWNQQRIYALQSGGAQPHVYPKDLHAIRVLIPSKKEQQAIANILTTASKETEQLQNRVNRLKQEKKALMQQLLTGKRRVNVDTEAA